MVAFLKELPEFGLVSWVKWALAQGPILHPCNHKAQDRVCMLGLMPFISGHSGNLQTIPYWVQDAQVTTVCLNRINRAFEVSFLHSLNHCCSDSVVCAQRIRQTSGPGHPCQGICITVSLPCSIVQLKIIIGKGSHQALTAWHPSLECTTGSFCWYRHQRLMHKDTLEIS